MTFKKAVCALSLNIWCPGRGNQFFWFQTAPATGGSYLVPPPEDKKHGDSVRQAG